MLGGAVRGLNLLVILAGLMVGILLMQWRFCRATLPGLTVRRFLPPEAYAGTPFKVRFHITNHRIWLPAWLVRLEDRIRAPALLSKGSEAVCSVAIVRPKISEVAQYECRIARRGTYEFGPVRLATGFPFGLLNAWQNTTTRARMVVYPKMAALAPNWSGMIENRREGLTASRNSSGPNDGEFFGIRSWRNGDSRRWIHWRTTARLGELAVRQFEQRNRTQLSLVLDPYLPPDQSDEDLERAISIAAAMVHELSLMNTNRLSIGIADSRAAALCSNRVTDFRHAALESLALVQGSEHPRLAETMVNVLADGNPKWPILIVSPRAARLDLLARDASSRDQTRGLTAELLARLEIIWMDINSVSGQRVSPTEVSAG
jgi:uncharacterized protein (DUF58 family)